MNKAIYAGSFDPFTNGHLDIVKKASKIFDSLDIVIGINTNKQRLTNIEDSIKAIEKTLEENNIKNCRVLMYDGLIAEYCKNNNIDYTIRGLRNNMDYLYEENISEINKLINPSLETIYLRTENAAISSSMVKELLKFNKDISKFVPSEVLKILKYKK